MRTTKEQAQNYFEILIQHQPESVLEILMELYSRKVNVEDWITSTAEDIIDSESQLVRVTGFNYIYLENKLNN